MTGYRRAWAARLAVVVTGAALVGSSSMSTASTAAEPPAPEPPSTSAALVSAGTLGIAAVGASQTLRVKIPEAMVGRRTPTADGSLEVPVLIAAGGPAGRAYVDPATTGCAWRLVPGVVTWVHCAAADRNQVRALVVVLDDGRTIARRL